MSSSSSSSGGGGGGGGGGGSNVDKIIYAIILHMLCLAILYDIWLAF